MPIGDNQCNNNSNSLMVIKEVILKPVLVTILADSKPPNRREIGQIQLMLNDAGLSPLDLIRSWDAGERDFALSLREFLSMMKLLSRDYSL